MNQIEKYFTAEKYESILFVMTGVIAISFAVYFLIRLRQPFFNGVAYPLMIIALIQIAVGNSVYFRSPKDTARVNEIFQNEKARINTEEIPRMEQVMRNFEIYRWVELALLVAGAILFFSFQPMTFWKGAGLGLFIQAGFMLLLDFFAESRGKVYLEFLRSLHP
jgi:hypothetical protein